MQIKQLLRKEFPLMFAHMASSLYHFSKCLFHILDRSSWIIPRYQNMIRERESERKTRTNSRPLYYYMLLLTRRLFKSWQKIQLHKLYYMKEKWQLSTIRTIHVRQKWLYGGKCKFVLEPCRGHHSKSTGITVGDIRGLFHSLICWLVAIEEIVKLKVLPNTLQAA